MRPIRLKLASVVFVGVGLVCSSRAAEPAPAPRPVEPLEDLIRSINDNPNHLYREFTPSVNKLIERGDPAIPRILDLIESNNKDTRLRAITVLRGITLQQHGCALSRGWRDKSDEARFYDLWISLGDLSEYAPRADRVLAVKLWRAWLVARDATTYLHFP